MTSRIQRWTDLCWAGSSVLDVLGPPNPRDEVVILFSSVTQFQSQVRGLTHHFSSFLSTWQFLSNVNVVGFINIPGGGLQKLLIHSHHGRDYEMTFNIMDCEKARWKASSAGDFGKSLTRPPRGAVKKNCQAGCGSETGETWKLPKFEGYIGL